MNPMDPLTRIKKSVSLFAIALVVTRFGLVPMAQAVVPPPDGGYPNFNTAEGKNALFSVTTGAANTAVGWYSLFSNAAGSFNTATGAGTLLFNTGDGNTAFGAAALLFNTDGTDNTAIGTAALLNNTTGGINTAVGSGALRNNSAGTGNTANGSQALFTNTVGSDNVAIGNGALFENIDGGSNTATGSQALFDNTTGSYNTAIGFQTLVFNTTGSQNTATGWSALAHNTNGDFNTANGLDALRNNTAGFQNVAMGYQALLNNIAGFKNTATGYQALINNTGSGNTALGYLAGSNLTVGDDNICIGSDGAPGDAGVIRIGRNFIGAAYIAGISGQTASGGAAVFVNSDGKLGTNTSSARFKEEIKPMGEASEAILALKPVSFRYKKHIDPRGTSQFGLVAEDVEKVNPELIIRDQDGKPHMVRYEQINAMLLNEFLKEHKKVQQLEASLAEQSKDFRAAIAELKKETDVKIQKVTAQIKLTKTSSRMVVKD